MDSTTSNVSSIKISWILGILGAFLIFVVIAAYASRMANDATPYDEPRKLERLDILAKQRKADADTLTTADWVDATKGTVRIPIDEAIPEEITTLKAKPVQMGAEIPGAAPKPAAGAAPGATTATTNAPAATKPNTIPAAAENEAPAGAPTAPATNAAPAAPPTPAPAAPNK